MPERSESKDVGSSLLTRRDLGAYESNTLAINSSRSIEDDDWDKRSTQSRIPKPRQGATYQRSDARKAGSDHDGKLSLYETTHIQ
jgi:hypothetical protein